MDIAVCTFDDVAGCGLLGLILVEKALAAAPDTLARDLMDPDPTMVLPELNQEEAAWKAAHRSTTGLVVVDAAGRFRGLGAPRPPAPRDAG